MKVAQFIAGQRDFLIFLSFFAFMLCALGAGSTFTMWLPQDDGGIHECNERRAIHRARR
jgi:hypothetical protein